MPRAVVLLGGGILGLITGSIFSTHVLAAFATTPVTWDASTCPAGLYTVTTTAHNAAGTQTFSVTSANIRLPQPSVTQQLSNLPRGQFTLYAISHNNEGRSFGSATQTLNTTAEGVTIAERRRPSAATPIGYARPRIPAATPVPTPTSGPQITADAANPGTIGGVALGPLDWRRFDLVDTDDDGLADLLRVELSTGEVRMWRIIRR